MDIVQPSFSFRWYGELTPVLRNYSDTQKMMEIQKQAGLSESARFRVNAIGQCGKVLDFGCSFGVLSQEIAQLGNEVTAIDLDLESIRIGKAFFSHPQLNYLCEDLFKMGIPDNHFDGILFSHTIEHLFNVELILKEFRRILKPGGKIVCATPNALSLSECIYGCLAFLDKTGVKTAKVINAEPKLPDLDHVSAYTRQTLCRLFSRMDFQVQTCEAIGTPAFELPKLPFRFPSFLRKLPFLMGFRDELVLTATKWNA